MKRSHAGVVAVAIIAAACSDASVPVAPARLAPIITPSASVSAEQVPDEYIVVLKRGSDVKSEAVRAERDGGKILAQWESALRGYAVRVPATNVAALRANPNIDYITPNLIAHKSGSETCAPYTTCGWGLDRIDQTSATLDGTYNYPTNTGNGVTVYIIDTGVRTTHQQFQGRASWGADFIDGSFVDCDGHGTHVASTVAGKDYGVAKGAKIVAVRVLDCTGSGTYAQVISGINWVTQHAAKPAVANMSLGGPADAATDQAVTNSIASGVSYAIAAGNSSTNACNQSPARTPNAITVGATGAGAGIPPATVDARPSYSNFGTCLDIFAPGTAILAAYNGSDTDKATLSGTSMATPHVAGSAALVLSKYPALTPAQVRDSLVNNALANVVTNAGSGSPNRLLNIGFLNVAGPPNQPPVARFTWSCNFTTLVCTLDAGTSTDDHGVVSYAWHASDPDRPNKSGVTITRAILGMPNPTPWNETLTVTDAQGLTSSVTQLIAPTPTNPNQPPTATITAPSNGASFNQGASVTFMGSGSDPEDGSLSGSSLVWSSNISGQIGTGTSFSTSSLPVGTHTITLTATDSKGAKGTATVSITIKAPGNQPPVADFTITCNTAQHYCELNAGTSTDDGGLANLTFTWTNSTGRPTRTGQIIRRNGSADFPATSTETLTVKDAGGLTSTISKVVSIP